MAQKLAASIRGVVTSAPTALPNGTEKYAYIATGGMSFKSIAPNAQWNGIVVGDHAQCFGEWRIHHNAAGVDVHILNVDADGYSGYGFLVAEDSPAQQQSLFASAGTGTVTELLSTYDATHKKFKMTFDTDPGEPLVHLTIVVSNAQADEWALNGSTPYLGEIRTLSPGFVQLLSGEYVAGL